MCVCVREVSDEMKARKTNSCNTSERKGARGEERGGERGGREKEEKRLQQPRENTEYAHASVSFKFPWISPIELNKMIITTWPAIT